MICWSIKTFCFPRLGFQKFLHVSLGYNIFGTISSFASTPHPLYFMTAQFSPIQFFVTAPLHKPTKFYAQNALCTLMNDSDVIFAADFKNSTSFLPSHHIFSLSATSIFFILTNWTITFKISFRSWSHYRLHLAVLAHKFESFCH